MEITPEFGPHRWVSFLQGSAEAALTRNLLTVSVNKQLSRQSHCLWCLQFIPHSQYVSEIKKTPQNVFPLILQESNFTNFALLLIFSPSWITVFYNIQISCIVELEDSKNTCSCHSDNVHSHSVTLTLNTILLLSEINRYDSFETENPY